MTISNGSYTRENYAISTVASNFHLQLSCVAKLTITMIIQWHGILVDFSFIFIFFIKINFIFGMFMACTFKTSINSWRLHWWHINEKKSVRLQAPNKTFTIIDNHFNSTKCKQIRIVSSKQWCVFFFSLMWSQCFDRNAVHSSSFSVHYRCTFRQVLRYNFPRISFFFLNFRYQVILMRRANEEDEKSNEESHTKFFSSLIIKYNGLRIVFFFFLLSIPLLIRQLCVLVWVCITIKIVGSWIILLQVESQNTTKSQMINTSHPVRKRRCFSIFRL